MLSIPAQAGQQHGVFTVEQALSCGWNLGALKRLTSAGSLIRLRRGAYALAETGLVGSQLERLRIGQRGVAAALRIPSATVSHVSAVAVHGLPLLADPVLPCVTLEPPLRTRPAQLHVHRQPIPASQLDASRCFRITSVARSCIDLTREQGLAAGLVAADAAVGRGLCTVADLDAVYSQSCRGRAGLATGRKLLKSIDASAQSPLESVSRLVFDGLVTPRSQVVIMSTRGLFIAQVDFYWDWLGLVGDVDDRLTYTDAERQEQRMREDALVEAGLVVVRWGWADARHPAILRARIERAMRQAAELRVGGLPVSAIVRPERRWFGDSWPWGPRNAAIR